MRGSAISSKRITLRLQGLKEKRRLDTAEMTHSMSRVGKCIDNGPMEAFWGILKCEKYYLHKYRTFEDLSHSIDDCSGKVSRSVNFSKGV